MLVDRQGCLGYLVPANGEQGSDALPETKEISMSREIWNEIASSKPETIFRNVTVEVEVFSLREELRPLAGSIISFNPCPRGNLEVCSCKSLVAGRNSFRLPS